MRRRLLHRLAAAVLALACFMPAPALAQDGDVRSDAAKKLGESGVVGGGAGTGDKSEKAPPVLSYALASLSAILVLVVVCMPTRKA
jgi:hypothetical protein